MKSKYFNKKEKGHSVRCKLYFNDMRAIKRIVICLHGFTGHMDNKAVERFADYVLKKNKDVAILIYNAPCHGDDVKKKLSLEDCDAYITLVTDYAKKQFKTDELYVYANSFGGYQALKYLSEHKCPFRKTALRCPAVNMFTVMDSLLIPEDRAVLEKNKPCSVGFDRKVTVTPGLLEELRSYDVRQLDYLDYAEDLLILHGTADEVVPFDVSREFAENNLIEFIPVEKADHRFQNPVHMSLAIKYVMEFFDLQNN